MGKRGKGKKGKKQTALDFAQGTVATFMRLAATLRAEAFADINRQNPDYDQLAAGLWNARLFAITPLQLADAHDSVYCQFGRTLPNTRVRPRSIGHRIHNATLVKFHSITNEHRPYVRFPTRLPFDYTYLGYGPDGIALSPIEMDMRGVLDNVAAPEDQGRAAAAIERVFLHGHLLWEAGESQGASAIYIVDWARRFSDVEVSTIAAPLYWRGEWTDMSSFDPWVLPSILEAINSHLSVTVERQPSAADRLRRKLLMREKQVDLPPPQPYYVVTLRDRVISVLSASRARQTVQRVYTYRHDVRAHERCLIKRGPLPLEPKSRSALVRRGYRVYEHRPPTGRDRKRMRKRMVATKLAHEWVAIKSVWVDQCIRPLDPDLPYVPAVRRMQER